MPYTVLGGSLSGNWSNYSQMNSAYNQINNIDSPLEVTMDLGLNGADISATADITITGDISGYTNPKVVFLISRFMTNTSADYVNRVVAYQPPTVFSITEIGESTTATANFTLDPDWNLAEVNAVCLIQSWTGTKNILQAATTGFTGIMPLMYSNVTSGPANLVVNFFNNSLPQGGIESWEWDFDGDGTFDSSEENPTYVYDTAGSYDVTLKIFDGTEYAETTFENYITVTEAGVAFSGNLSGVWNADNNPYIIDADVTIDQSSSLVINAGTEIILEEASFLVYNEILILGSETDKVIFSSNSSWEGIRIIGENSEAIITNCSFSNATNAAISIENGPNVQILNSMFSDNHSNAKAAGIELTNSNDVTIENNVFVDNFSENGPGAILCNGSSPTIYNNLIMTNTADFGAFSFKSESAPIVINNTIANNSSNAAIMMFFNSYPHIMNNIIRDDLGTILSIASVPNFSYNNICADVDGEGNINVDPMFQDVINYMLADGSPCIDSGNPLAEYNDLDGSRNDMGAWGGANSFVVNPVDTDEYDINNLETAQLLVYPNPFNPSRAGHSSSGAGRSATTTISFSSVSNLSSDATIEIYNVKGQLIRQFRINNLESRIKEVVWNGKDENNHNVSSGVYLIKLQSKDTIILQKAMLLK